MEKEWYGVKTFNGYEQKVIDSLQRQIEKENMGSLIGEIYLPKINEYVQTRNGYVLKEKLLFPGYIFVEMEMTNETIFFVRGIQYVTGYAGISSMKENPSPMDFGEIDAIKDTSKNIIIDIKSGDKVVIINHDLLADQEVIVRNIDLVNEFIEVEIDNLLGDDYSLEKLKFDQFKKLT